MVDTTSAGPSAGEQRKQRKRAARQAGLRTAAMEIISERGLEAMTMQAVADAVDSAIGTVYLYYPSKGALTAAVQRSAILRISRSYDVYRSRLAAELADEDDPVVAALTPALGVGRFWTSSTTTHPHEYLLMAALMSASGTTMNDEEGMLVYPAAIDHLERARRALTDAGAAGAITEGPEWERVVVWIAAINGIVQVSRLADLDPVLFDGVRLADRHNDEMLLAWGADPIALMRAAGHLDRLAEDSPLAPPVAPVEE